jgi:hypothetical protein
MGTTTMSQVQLQMIPAVTIRAQQLQANRFKMGITQHKKFSKLQG